MLSAKNAAPNNHRLNVIKSPRFIFLNFVGSICHSKTMQRHLKTLLLHYELKHKEGFIDDPESPGLLSVALVNWTIVCGAFASQVGFSLCV